MASVTLDYVSIKGFKSIKLINELRLMPINLLIGANGSGKSNFINVFSFLHAVREGTLQDYVRRSGGAEQLLHYGSKVSSEIKFEISFNDEVNKYRLKLEPTDDDSLFPANESASYWEKMNYSSSLDRHLASRENGKEAGISNPNIERIGGWVRERLGGWRLYHVHDTSSSSAMRKTAQVNDNQYLRSNGSNLPAFLYFLKEKHPDSYRLISGAIRRVAPYFEDFALEPDRLNEEMIRLEWRHKGSDQYFGPSSLSDGTLRYIALATLLLQPAELRPSVILVDEPELGLHPAAIEMLASLVRQASTSSQVILSTQSSLLLDHVSPEHVLVAERESGATRLHRLDPNRLEEWLEDYSLGQLWEKNELGGRPGGE